MICPTCNKQVPDDSVFCTFCGNHLLPKPQGQTYNTGSSYSYQQPSYHQSMRPQIDDAGCLALFLSFVSPLIGLALYVIWRDYRPNSAKTCLVVALVSLAISVVAGIIMAIVSIATIPFEEFEDFQNIQKIISSLIT